MKRYLITWYTKIGSITDHAQIIEADTAQQAREKFDNFCARKANIMGDGFKAPHKFGLRVRLAKEEPV